MPKFSDPNEALLDVARHALARTSWGFEHEGRACRDLIFEAVEKIRSAERLIELKEDDREVR